MLLGYNTNGFAHHRLVDAIEVLAEIGYRSVAITVDHHALPPNSPRHADEMAEVREALARHGMRSVIETGARFLLDPRRKHEPTLMSADPRRRMEFYRYAVDCAAELGADCVALFSGILRDPISQSEAWDRLVPGLRAALDYAAARGVLVGFEPEPGMFVDSMDRFEELLERIDDARLRLTLDIGHLHCQGETPIARVIDRWASLLVNVHIEDMCCGVHEHLMFGQGEIDFPPVLQALARVGYNGPVHVELSRHSHQAPEAAREAFEFLTKIER